MIGSDEVQFDEDERYVIKHSLGLCGCQGADQYLLNRIYVNKLAIEKAKAIYRNSHSEIQSLDLHDIEIILISVTHVMEEKSGVFNNAEVQLDARKLRKKLIRLRKLGGITPDKEQDKAGLDEE